MSRIAPGAFVPDLAPSSAKPTSEPLDGVAGISGVTGTAASSFKDTLSTMLNDVNDKMLTADSNTRDLASGKSHDFDGTIRSVEEGQLAMQFTMAIRNKLMDSYQEIQRMQL